MLEKFAPQIEVKIDGQSVSDDFSIGEVRIQKHLNKITSAKIKLIPNGIKDDAYFDVIDKEIVKPGGEILLSAATKGDKLEEIFNGLIVAYSMKLRGEKPTVILTCKDKALGLTLARKNKIFIDKSDDEIIKEITSDYKLTTKIDSCNVKYPEMVQFQMSDWDYINMRAEANGLHIINESGELNITKIGGGIENVATINMDDKVYNVNLDIDSSNIISAVKGVSWDMKKSEVYTIEKKGGESIPTGSWKESDLSKAIFEATDTFTSFTSTESASIDTKAEAILNRGNMSKVLGTVKVWASPEITVGNSVKLEGFSKIFDGEALVAGVEHVIADGNWFTTVFVGMDPELYANKTPNVITPAGGGNISPIQGLITGIVQKIESDPEGQLRVQVALSNLEDDAQPIWARLIMPYTAEESGFFFMPEIGNEVVVGFLDSNPAFPIVMGSLYNVNVKAAYEPNEENTSKSIKTKAGFEILFDEENELMNVVTPEGNTLTLDDKNKLMSMVDINDNELTLSEDGITLKSGKDIILDATGNVTIAGGQNVEIEATSDFAAAGLNVAIEGSAGAELAGPQVTVKGDAMTEISGGIVKIN